ncbi:MAG: S8 family serine peptidase [Methanothrix sp.]
MRRVPLVLVLAAALLLSMQFAHTESSKIDPAVERMMSSDDPVPVIVIFRDGCSPDLGGIDVRYRYHLINGISAVCERDEIRRLAEDDGVEGIYLDGDVSVTAPVSSQGGDSVCPSEMVDAERVWAEGIDGSGVIVAIIDSGIDKNHPDLAGKVIGERNFVEGEDTTEDLVGHGTLCAGIIAGSGKASGGRYKGIAPGARLLNVRVIGSDGNGKVSDIIAGIEWSLDNGARVLSLSLAGLNLGETNPPVTMAADKAMDAGAVVCVAAGNNG